MFGFVEAGPDDASGVRGIAADAYTGPAIVEGALDIDRAAAAGRPIVEEPAQLARVVVGVEVTVGQLKGGVCAFLPGTLEVEFEEGVAAEFAQDVGGVEGGYALPACKGGRPICKKERAAPISDFGGVAEGGPQGRVSEEYADVWIVCVKVLREFGESVLDLGALPIEEGDVIARWAVLADVADKAGLAVDAYIS